MKEREGSKVEREGILLVLDCGVWVWLVRMNELNGGGEVAMPIGGSKLFLSNSLPREIIIIRCV